MSSFIDQTGRKVVISTPPQRIISLVPSQTELLSCLGLNDEVIAITKFCVHPASWFRTKKRIGGTKKLHVDTIINLQPQLVVANKEENVKEQIDSIAKHCPVWISDVFHLGSALEMIRQLGVICGKRAESERVAADIETKFSVLVEHQSQEKVRAAYLIWQQPFMTVGGDTFINDMLQRAGFENIFEQRKRY
ncbi:MAG TPA: helical backbone metal receptor, partial [Chitinophagaceae bacterium]|nr:helical backbone metal receptor [Chitinophagaceae bacterium]